SLVSSTSSLPVRLLLFFAWFPALRALHSFPTRRSSDLRFLAVSLTNPATSKIKQLRVTTLIIEERQHPQKVFPRRLNLMRRMQRSEEHTSELQSRFDLVCRLLLEKKKTNNTHMPTQVTP